MSESAVPLIPVLHVILGAYFGWICSIFSILSTGNWSWFIPFEFPWIWRNIVLGSWSDVFTSFGILMILFLILHSKVVVSFIQHSKVGIILIRVTTDFTPLGSTGLTSSWSWMMKMKMKMKIQQICFLWVHYWFFLSKTHQILYKTYVQISETCHLWWPDNMNM